MPSVYKRTRDKKRKGSCWYFAYYDEDGRRQVKKGFTDKAATEAYARKLESEAQLRRRGVIDPKADAYAVHDARPMSENLADWGLDMAARAKTAGHVDQYRDRAGKLIALVKGGRIAELEPGRRRSGLERAAARLDELLRSSRPRDLTTEAIQSALAAVRDAGKSPQTVNHYRA